GVLLRGVNDTPEALLDLSFALLDEAEIVPYYLYMCDMIPYSEHWRLPLWRAQELQHAIMGYLPGFATPRIVCDVPYVGKRWVHQPADYDRERGISYWTKNYRTALEGADPHALSRRHGYYDPIPRRPPAGGAWWRERIAGGCSFLELERAMNPGRGLYIADQKPGTGWTVAASTDDRGTTGRAPVHPREPGRPNAR